MMNTLGNISDKKEDFKICKECTKLNWYENKCCLECDSTEFNEREEYVKAWTESNFNYFKQQKTPFAIANETLYET